MYSLFLTSHKYFDHPLLFSRYPGQGVPAEYSKSIYTKIVDDIRQDLTVLESIEPLHIRAKLLTYCVNTRFDYFLSTDSLATMLPFADEVDTSVESAICKMLQWRNDNGEATTALSQLRLSISKGDWGVRSMVHSAQAAILGMHLSYFKWSATHEDALRSCDILQSAEV